VARLKVVVVAAPLEARAPRESSNRSSGVFSIWCLSERHPPIGSFAGHSLLNAALGLHHELDRKMSAVSLQPR